MRHDIRAIQDQLHADTVDVTGDGVERLTQTAAEAAERGRTSGCSRPWGTSRSGTSPLSCFCGLHPMGGE
jgi:hypothetical protein